MRHERQMELLDRLAAAGTGMKGLQSGEPMVNDAEVYIDHDRFNSDQQTLFRDGPVFFCLSADLPEPGHYRTGVFDGIPVAVVRQPDGSVRAMVNACRHRGAPVFEPFVGPHRPETALRSVSCPYHAWNYDLSGALRARPASHGAFDSAPGSPGLDDCNLHPVAVAEGHGLIMVRPGGTEPIDLDATLGGIQSDLDDFGLADQILVESRTETWSINWKLAMDTFMEVYHVRTLHSATIGPYFNSDALIYEPFGHNFTATAFRKNILDEMDKPRDQRSMLPYATVQYFLVPNGLIAFQLDHFEVWRMEPIDPTTTRTTTSIYAMAEPVTDEVEAYLSKNLDLLLEVIGTEDFPLMAKIQANLASGRLPQIVYGRNEPALAHFHRSLAELTGQRAG